MLANGRAGNLPINDLLAIVNAVRRGFFLCGVLVTRVELLTLLSRLR